MIGIVQRWLQVPDTLEFPRMLCAVVPLVGRERFPGFRRSVVNKLVTFPFLHAVRALQFFLTAAGCVPFFTAVVRALNDLAKPTTGLRRIDSVGMNRRTFHVINFPAREMRSADFPSFPRAIRSENERALPRAN